MCENKESIWGGDIDDVGSSLSDYDVQDVQGELVSTLDWMIKTMEFQKEAAGVNDAPSEELRKAKSLLRDLQANKLLVTQYLDTPAMEE